MTDHPQTRVKVSELELEEVLPGFRPGSVDLVVNDEYDGKCSSWSAGVPVPWCR